MLGRAPAVHAGDVSSFSTLTTAQLETLRDNCLASLNRSTNAQKYSTPGDSLERMSPQDALEILSKVDAELAARTDETGGIGVIEFEEPI